MQKTTAIIMLFLGLILGGCQGVATAVSKNSTENTTIDKVKNDSISIATAKNESAKVEEQTTLVIDEVITECYKDTTANVIFERVINRTTTKTSGKVAEVTKNEQADTTIIKNENTQETSNKNEITQETSKEIPKKNNTMLWVFLSLLVILVIYVIIKFF